MDGIDVGVLEQIVKIGITFIDAKRVADGIQFGLGALADRIHIGVWVLLINGNEFGAETEPNDGDVNFTLVHDASTKFAQELPAKHFGNGRNRAKGPKNCQLNLDPGEV